MEPNVKGNSARSVELRGNTGARDITGFLIDNIGEALTTVAVRAKSVQSLRDWRDGTAVPSPEQMRKLRILHDATKEILRDCDSNTARSFLRSSNGYLGDQSAVMVIADSKDLSHTRSEIMDAVRIFLE